MEAANPSAGREHGLRGGSTGGSSSGSAAWEQREILAPIKCKHNEHAALKALVDLRNPNGSRYTEWTNLQKTSLHNSGQTYWRPPEDINTRVMQNEKMCKDKWNGLNSDSKKVADYHNTREPATTNQFGHFSLAFQHCNWHDAFVHAEIRFQPDTFSTYINFRFQPDALSMSAFNLIHCPYSS